MVEVDWGDVPTTLLVDIEQRRVEEEPLRDVLRQLLEHRFERTHWITLGVIALLIAALFLWARSR